MKKNEKVNLTELIENKIDRTKWRKFKISDLVENFTEKVVPKESELEHYIGLKDLDSGSLKIRRFGKTESLKGNKLKVYKGDLIFAKRNAYLKRVAIADFDAVVSAHALVLRAKIENVLPEFLPFFFLSEKFWEKAIEISVGSLSPTINWRVLAKQEFLLPPLDQQAELAELLWAMDGVIEAEKVVLETLERTLNTQIEKEIHGIELKNKTIKEALSDLKVNQEVKKLSQLGVFLKGKGIPKAKVIKEGIPCVRYGELYTKHHRVIRTFSSFIEEATKSSSMQLKKHDILFAGSGETLVDIGKSAAFVGEEEAYVGSDTLLFRPHDMDGFYLGYLMNSKLVRQQLNKYGTGATVIHIYNSDLKKIVVPIKNRATQEEIAQKLEKIASNISMQTEQIAASQALQKSLINQIF